MGPCGSGTIAPIASALDTTGKVAVRPVSWSLRTATARVVAKSTTPTIIVRTATTFSNFPARTETNESTNNTITGKARHHQHSARPDRPLQTRLFRKHVDHALMGPIFFSSIFLPAMRSREALSRLPSLKVLAQRPVEYIRLHHALVARIEKVAPVHDVHSVDEVSLELSPSDDPAALTAALREAVHSSFSEALTFAAGVASSVWLAKVAAKCGKGPSGDPGGAVDWRRPPELRLKPSRGLKPAPSVTSAQPGIQSRCAYRPSSTRSPLRSPLFLF